MLSNVPTDNLYKFVTFLGIILFAFCAWSLNENTNKTELSFLDAKMREMGMQKEVEYLDRRIAYFALLSDDQALTQASKTRLVELQKASEENVTAARKIYEDLAHASLEREQNSDQSRYLKIGIVLGLLMSILGIISWYCLHQRFQDIVVRYQASHPTS